jgi:hypothetical protein
MLKPFELLFNPAYKNSILICGINTDSTNQIDNIDLYRKESENKLFNFAADRIDKSQKTIVLNNRRIFLFANFSNTWQHPLFSNIVLYKKQEDAKKRHLYPLANRIFRKSIEHFITERSYIIYNIPWHTEQKNSRDIKNYLKYLHTQLVDKELPCLLLIDEALLQRYDALEKTIYDKFAGKKEIITYNPYAKTIRNYCPINEKNVADYSLPCTLLCATTVGLICYYNPEIGKCCLDALQYMSMT